jgi:hypothetical protein
MGQRTAKSVLQMSHGYFFVFPWFLALSAFQGQRPSLLPLLDSHTTEAVRYWTGSSLRCCSLLWPTLLCRNYMFTKRSLHLLVFRKLMRWIRGHATPAQFVEVASQFAFVKGRKLLLLLLPSSTMVLKIAHLMLKEVLRWCIVPYTSLPWYDLKVCDDGTLVQILHFWTLSIVLSLSKLSFCLSFKTQRFGDWILSPSSGKTYLVGSKINKTSSIGCYLKKFFQSARCVTRRLL